MMDIAVIEAAGTISISLWYRLLVFALPTNRRAGAIGLLDRFHSIRRQTGNIGRFMDALRLVLIDTRDEEPRTDDTGPTREYLAAGKQHAPRRHTGI